MIKSPHFKPQGEQMFHKIQVAGVAVFLATSLSFATTYATYKGGKITDKEINAVLAQVPNQPTIESLNKEQLGAISKQLVEQILLSQYAVKNGVKKTKSYKEKLAQFEQYLAATTWIEEEFKKIKVSDKEIKDFYNKNKDKFKQPASTQLSSISVNDEKKANEILKELKKAKKANIQKTFAALAKKDSTDLSNKDKGGNLGFIPDTQLQVLGTEIAGKIAKLKLGEYTKEAVKSDRGYHIFLVTDKKKESYVPYETIATQLEASVKNEKLKKTLDKKLGELTKKANVKYTK